MFGNAKKIFSNNPDNIQQDVIRHMLSITPKNASEDFQVAAGELISLLITENCFSEELHEEVSLTCDEMLELWSEPVLHIWAKVKT